MARTSSGIQRYGVEKIDCVELVPGVLNAARWFPEMNRGVLGEPNYTVIRGDGRNYALVSDETYDVISIDATSPKMAGNGSLYSLEFYRLLRKRSTEEGLLVQWLPFHLLSDEETRMTARTFQAVFPRHYPLAVTTEAPRRPGGDHQPPGDRCPGPAPRIGDGDHPGRAGAHVRDGAPGLPELVRDGGGDPRCVRGRRQAEHGRSPYLEFTPALALFMAGRYQVQNLARFQESRESVLPLLTNLGEGEEERTAFAERVQKRYEATQYALRGDVLYYLGRREEAREAYTRAMLTDPESQEWLKAMQLF
ncbi:MAG: tetratricopeptide repeat protein [Gemmatimonadota bacterium]